MGYGAFGDSDGVLDESGIWPLIVAYGDRRAAEARQEAAGDALKLLYDELHLAMYGERAEGGNETWRAHWHDVELFVRGTQFRQVSDV